MVGDSLPKRMNTPIAGRSVQKLKTTVVMSETRSKHGLRAPSHSTLFRDSGRIRRGVTEDGYGQPATFTDRTPVKMAATA